MLELSKKKSIIYGMRFYVLSDIHLEFGDFTPIASEDEYDAVILAGDIHVGTQAIEWIKKTFPNKPVFYVPGNHEYYNNDLNLIDDLKKDLPSNLYILDNTKMIIGDCVVCGGTLWTDFNALGLAETYFAKHSAKDNMSDFDIIKDGDKKFTPDRSTELHKKTLDYIKFCNDRYDPEKGWTNKDDHLKMVVVSHHAPSSKSSHPRFKGTLLNAAFYSDLEDFVIDSNIKLWVHGHMHNSSDYYLANARVVCNPRGYVGQEINKEFDPGLIIEV